MANVVVQYADYLTPGDADALGALGPGRAAVVRDGLQKIAAYRDEEGTMHAFSAVCTHLGCVVRWNSAESTWDCPCHGSRFDKMDGHVLNGPAISGLAPVEDPTGLERHSVAREAPTHGQR